MWIVWASLLILVVVAAALALRRRAAPVQLAAAPERVASALAALGPPPQRSGRAYQPQSPEHLLYADRDIAGWNNIVMAFEVELGLAYDWKRTVMLPKPQLWAHINQDRHIFDYFDEGTFHSVVPAIEYDPVVPLHQITVAPTAPPSAPKVQIVYRLFGNVEKRHRPWLDRALRFRTDILEQARRLLASHQLGDDPYVALHVRRGAPNDFKHQFSKEGNIANETIVKHIQDSVRGQSVLVLSDDYDTDLLSRLKTVASRVVCWSGTHRSADGVSDMLCAVPAQEFFGTPLSTFSSGIVKMRQRAGTHTEVRYTHQYNEKDIPDWGRT
jgi:hypothetical protein